MYYSKGCDRALSNIIRLVPKQLSFDVFIHIFSGEWEWDKALQTRGNTTRTKNQDWRKLVTGGNNDQ